MVQGLGVWDSGFGIQGLRFKVVLGEGFGIQG